MAPPDVLRGPVSATGAEILRAIIAWDDEHGYAPTFRDIGDLFGMASSSSPYNHLVKLRAIGAVTWVDQAPRTLVITAAGRKALGYDD